MNVPGMTGEASVYKSNNHYRSTAGGRLLIHENANVALQSCGVVEGVVCGTVIAGAAVICTASCLAGAAAGPGGAFPCYLCLVGALGALYGFCRDCLPAWILDIINSVDGGGGSGGGAGGGGGPLPCCPSGRPRCCGTCRPRPGGTGLICDGQCIGPGESCP
jgi:hypothetical protein